MIHQLKMNDILDQLKYERGRIFKTEYTVFSCPVCGKQIIERGFNIYDDDEMICQDCYRNMFY